MLIDTHVHYNLEPLFSKDTWTKIPGADDSQLPEYLKKYGKIETKDDGWYHPEKSWQEHWQKAQSEGIIKSIVVGTDDQDGKLARWISSQEDGLFCALGVHPGNYQDQVEQFLSTTDQDLEAFLQPAVDKLKTDIQSADKLVAIGETGLDYYRLRNNPHLKEIQAMQKASFVAHIQLAQSLHLPLILHVRDVLSPEEHTSGNAYWDALDILQELGVEKFVLHCVSGPLSYVKAAVEMGGYMGFDGNLTYHNAQHILQIFTTVPPERILIETDAPFLPPQQFRGKVCEPWMMVQTARYMREQLGFEPEQCAANAARLFGI